MPILTFAVETSCDETSVAILSDYNVLSNIISSQYFHSEYGGIVPELASRAHIKAIDKIVSSAFEKSGIKNNDIKNFVNGKGPFKTKKSFEKFWKDFK